jgi:hypothetical protein
MQARLATRVEMRGAYTAMWDGTCHGSHKFHVARRDIGIATEPPELEVPGSEGWDALCERCGEVAPWGRLEPCPEPDCDHLQSIVNVSSSTRSVWDTPSGKLEPGCLYWSDWCDHDGRCIYGWTNCDGRHLHAVLPNGHHWDIDSRANNCALKHDTVHRCWIRHGEPPAVHVDKDGLTCAAGAGSIAAGGYHGFLHNGAFSDG